MIERVSVQNDLIRMKNKKTLQMKFNQDNLHKGLLITLK